MKKFKIRASACGVIMTNNKAQTGMGETAKKYCENWLKEQLYNREFEITSKHMEKGLIMEDNSLDLIASHFGYGMILKNEKSFENEHMTGTPDAIMPDHVIDVKNSWDCFTFPLFDDKIDKNYFYQAQVYMHLVGREQYKLIYTLMNTPMHLIEKEAYYFAKNSGFENVDSEIMARFVEKHTYDKINTKHRVKLFAMVYEPEVIEQIKARVLECREYINQLKSQL